MDLDRQQVTEAVHDAVTPLYPPAAVDPAFFTGVWRLGALRVDMA
jgi:hypothetical protein